MKKHKILSLSSITVSLLLLPLVSCSTSDNSSNSSSNNSLPNSESTPADPSGQTSPISVANKTFTFKSINEEDLATLDETTISLIETTYFVFGDNTVESWAAYGYSFGPMDPYKQFGGTFVQNDSIITYSYDHWLSGPEWQEMSEQDKANWSNMEARLTDNKLDLTFWFNGEHTEGARITYEYLGQ